MDTFAVVPATGFKRLISGRWWITKRMPYFAEIFLAMTPLAVPGYGTFGITPGLMLLYDPALLDVWSVKKIGFVIAHEAMHRVNRHFERAERANIPVTEYHRRVWNFAGDAMINEVLVRACGFAPDDAILPGSLDLPSNITIEEAYAILIKREPPPEKSEGEGNGGQGDEHQPCGSGAGCEHPAEPPDIEKHPASRSDSEVKHVIRQVARQIQSARSQGNVPGELEAIAEAILGAPRVPWEVLLRRALRNACTFVSGASEVTWGRAISKLQGGIGFGSGVALLPTLVDPEIRAWFVLDTSGSMSNEDMLDAAREVSGILRAAGGRLTYMANDARVQLVREVTDAQQLKGLFRGRGGTNFHPIFERCAEAKRADKPNIIVVATDGDGPAPEVGPVGVHVVWLLVQGQHDRPTTWGTYIELSKDSAKTLPAWHD